MKMLIAIALVIAAVYCVNAQNNSPLKWNVVIKVVDDNGQPIAGADAWVAYGLAPSFRVSAKNQEWDKLEGLTDTNGIFNASHSDTRSMSLGFHVRKFGYYPTDVSYNLAPAFAYNATNWNPSVTLVLKKIGKPISMYARKIQIEIPKTNLPIGFDLVEGDWVAPYGKGKQNDFIFQANRRWVNRNDFECTVKLNFSNRNDGLFPILIPFNQGSELRMSAIAPLGVYLPEISKSFSRTPANGWKDDERGGNKEQNYYFRIRTVLDGQGNVKDGSYGKIYDDFALDPINSKTTWILFTYYLNSTPNDRNVEFDIKQNLFKNLKPDEGVNSP